MPRSSSNDFILVVPYYSRRLPTGRHGTARNFVETGLNKNSRFPNWSPVDGWDFVVFLDLFPKVGQMTCTAIAFPRESRSNFPFVTHSREDRPARRTLPFFSIRRTDPPRRIGLCRFSRFVSKSWQNVAPGRSFVYIHKWSLPSSSPSFPSFKYQMLAKIQL